MGAELIVLHGLARLPRPVWLLFAATAILRIGAFVYPYLTIYLTRARGLSTADAGWILAAGGCGLIAGNLIGGQASDRWSRKGTLVGALAINGCGYLGLLLTGEWTAGYALWLGVAYVGAGMFTPAAQTIVADLVGPSDRSLAYAGFYLSSNLGIAVGPLLGGLLAAQSFTLVFVGDIATTVASLALVLFGLPAMTRPESRRSAPTTGFVSVYRRHPHVTAFCAANFFLIAPLMGLEYSVPLLVEREFAAPLYWVGVVYTINAVSIVVSSLALERWVRGRSEVAFMLVAAGLWSAGLIVLAAGWSVTALLISTLVWTFGEILASILVPSFVAARVPAEVKGRFMALADLGRSVASVLSPIGLGYAWLHAGAGAAVGAIVALPLVGLVAFSWIAWTSRAAVRRA